jgi:hypothetical protein
MLTGMQELKCDIVCDDALAYLLLAFEAQFTRDTGGT